MKSYVEKTKCKKTSTSHEHNAGHQEMNTANKAFKNVAKFMSLGAALTHKYSICLEVRIIMNLGNVYYLSAQNLFSAF
jgi:hypothetical protein